MSSPVDFAALARQFGGKSALSSHEPAPQQAPQPSQDYGALAQQYGGRTLIQQPPRGQRATLPAGSEMDDPLTMAVGFAKGLLGFDQQPGFTPSGVGALLGAALPVTKGLNVLKTAVSGEQAAKDAIIAYHGSPHDFDQFSLSKIGTGEGNQAFGHGLYFAESPAVAEVYKGLQGRASIDPAANIASKVIQSGQNPSHRLRSVFPSMSEEEISAAITRARNPPEGKMYQVNINASPDDFLDWDKPLSQQSEKIQQVFRDVPQSPDIPGQLAVYRLGDKKINNPEAAKKMLEGGIPGIKYLDGGSRASGEGTRNYVVFDDSLVDILKKYGVLLPAIGMLQRYARANNGTVPSNVVESMIPKPKKQ